MSDATWGLTICVLLFLLLNVIFAIWLLVRELNKDECPDKCPDNCPYKYQWYKDEK